MEADKLDTIIKSVGNTVRISFGLLVTLINIFITVFFMFGAAAAIILLFKMFPETSLILMKPLLVVSLVIFKIFKIVFLILYFLIVGYGVMYFFRLFDGLFSRQKKRMEKKKKKFMDDLVKKLKVEFNKK